MCINGIPVTGRLAWPCMPACAAGCCSDGLCPMGRRSDWLLPPLLRLPAATLLGIWCAARWATAAAAAWRSEAHPAQCDGSRFRCPATNQREPIHHHVTTPCQF